jgi:16S rRNA (cytidine1402-2'-O)-methyltransferase
LSDTPTSPLFDPEERKSGVPAAVAPEDRASEWEDGLPDELRDDCPDGDDAADVGSGAEDGGDFGAGPGGSDGRLWVVATPLGNGADLSPRAREVLQRVDVVLAEDTRRTGLLFKRLGMRARRFVSFHDHNERTRAAGVLRLLADGAEIALVSDAGTPLLSDPGYRLVRACREQGVPVSPVPGPTAPAAALSAAGLPPLPFTFLGFLPRAASEARALLARYGGPGAPPTTLVFFERKDRLAATLELAHAALGPREVCVARELTKVHEEFIVGRLGEAGWLPGELLGELTVVVGPPEEPDAQTREEVLAVAAEERAAGGRPKDVARRVQARVRGWSVKQVYELLRDAQGGRDGR